MCNFLTADVLAALAAAGMSPEQLAKAQAAKDDMCTLAAEIVPPQAEAAGASAPQLVQVNPVHRSPGTEQVHRRMVAEAARLRTAGHEGRERAHSKDPVAGRGRRHGGSRSPRREEQQAGLQDG